MYNLCSLLHFFKGRNIRHKWKVLAEIGQGKMGGVSLYEEGFYKGSGRKCRRKPLREELPDPYFQLPTNF